MEGRGAAAAYELIRHRVARPPGHLYITLSGLREAGPNPRDNSAFGKQVLLVDPMVLLTGRMMQRNLVPYAKINGIFLEQEAQSRRRTHDFDFTSEQSMGSPAGCPALGPVEIGKTSVEWPESSVDFSGWTWHQKTSDTMQDSWRAHGGASRRILLLGSWLGHLQPWKAVTATSVPNRPKS